MKVKISYSVDIDEVPGLINKIVSECKLKLAAEADNIKSFTYDVDKMANQIEETRKVLSLVDSQLEDAVYLATGWLETKKPSATMENLQDYESMLAAASVDENQEIKDEQEG